MLTPAEARLTPLILAVGDLSRSVQFYRDAFGWSQLVAAPVYAEFALPGGRRLRLYAREAFGRNTGQMPSAAPPGQLTGAELYFHVDDTVGVIGSLLAAGARQLDALATRDWGDEAAYFADPDGNVLVAARPLAPA